MVYKLDVAVRPFGNVAFILKEIDSTTVFLSIVKVGGSNEVGLVLK